MVNHYGVKKVDLEIHTLEQNTPTVSNSKLADHVSPGIEPYLINIFTEQTSKGTFIRKNGELIKVLRKAGINNKDTWDKIMEDGGSIQGIKELDKWCYLDGKMVLCSEIKNGDRDKIYPIKDVFRTFKEINQMDLVKQLELDNNILTNQFH